MPIQLLDVDELIEVKDTELGVSDGDESVTYTLRVLTPQVYRALTKKHTKKRPTGGRGMEEYLDGAAWSDAMWDYVLHSWNPGAMLWKGQPIGADDTVIQNGEQVKAKFQLDGPRKTALLDKAGLNAVIKADAEKEQSFRGAAEPR